VILGVFWARQFKRRLFLVGSLEDKVTRVLGVKERAWLGFEEGAGGKSAAVRADSQVMAWV
jgi:hypothetical protein